MGPGAPRVLPPLGQTGGTSLWATTRGNPGSTRFYAWAIWGAFRAEVYGYGPGAMRVLLWAIWRVRLAVRSGGVRRPGALLATLLKAEGVLALFRQAPPWRVA